MASIFLQIKAFLYTIVLGLLAGMILHSYQLLVKKMVIRQYALYLLDFIFWFLMIIIIFAFMLYINQGEMRSYVLIALILGALIYNRAFSAKTNPALSKIMDFIIVAAQKLIKYLFYYPRHFIRRIQRMAIIYTTKEDYDPDDRDNE